MNTTLEVALFVLVWALAMYLLLLIPTLVTAALYRVFFGRWPSADELRADLNPWD